MPRARPNECLEFVLVIYPLGFPKTKPEVIPIWGIDNEFDAREFAAVYTLERFNSPLEFSGYHVVRLED